MQPGQYINDNNDQIYLADWLNHLTIKSDRDRFGYLFCQKIYQLNCTLDG